MRSFGRAAVALLIVGAVTLVCQRLGATDTTSGFAYLITVLAIAAWTNFTTSLISSVAALLCYNYFFIPRLGSLVSHETEDWVALASFLVASVIASRLVLRARRQAAHAEARRREVEALYALSIDLFAASNRTNPLAAATARALASVGAEGGGLVLLGEEPRAIAWSDADAREWREAIDVVAGRRAPLEIDGSAGRDVLLPLNIGGEVIGVVVARGTATGLRALESAATLVALAVERERFLAESAHIRALEEGDALKTSLFRAVSHDLVTPLTAIGLQIDRLRSLVDGAALTLIGEMAQHAGRLRRRIENLLAMARLEARSVVPNPEPTPAADLFRSVREHLPLVAESRPIEIHVEPDCPDVHVDPSLALEILVNLVENAHQAAPPHTAVELSAFRHPQEPERVRLEIADRGPGVARGPSDTARRGLGLDIARSLAAASSGQVTLANRDGGGAVAQVDLPAAHLPEAEEVGS